MLDDLGSPKELPSEMNMPMTGSASVSVSDDRALGYRLPEGYNATSAERIPALSPVILPVVALQTSRYKEIGRRMSFGTRSKIFSYSPESLLYSIKTTPGADHRAISCLQVERRGR